MAGLSELVSKMTALPVDSLASISEEDRLQALSAVQKLTQHLEKPSEVIRRWACETQAQMMSIRVAIDLKIFHILAKEDVAIASADLASRCKAEELLIIRLMRALVGIGFAAIDGSFKYKATPTTKAMTSPDLESLYLILYDDPGQAHLRLHQYFKLHGYKCPTDYVHTPFQWHFDIGQGYFEWLKERPEQFEAFNMAMTGMRTTQKFWADFYPVQSNLLDGFKDGPDGVLLVDIAGGMGHDLEALLHRLPQSSGHLVLQDLPQVIDVAKTGLKKGIIPQAHDFFTPYITKGARAYFTHYILHDWPDKQAREILLHLKAAMQPGYSKLLLNESILPDGDCPPFYAGQDLNMMCIVAGMERSRKQWAELIDSVGLHILQIWDAPEAGNLDGVIEVILLES